MMPGMASGQETAEKINEGKPAQECYKEIQTRHTKPQEGKTA